MVTYVSAAQDARVPSRRREPWSEKSSSEQSSMLGMASARWL